LSKDSGAHDARKYSQVSHTNRNNKVRTTSRVEKRKGTAVFGPFNVQGKVDNLLRYTGKFVTFTFVYAISNFLGE